MTQHGNHVILPYKRDSSWIFLYYINVNHPITYLYLITINFIVLLKSSCSHIMSICFITWFFQIVIISMNSATWWKMINYNFVFNRYQLQPVQKIGTFNQRDITLSLYNNLQNCNCYFLLNVCCWFLQTWFGRHKLNMAIITTWLIAVWNVFSTLHTCYLLVTNIWPMVPIENPTTATRYTTSRTHVIFLNN